MPASAQAASYVLAALLPRLEALSPGLTDDLAAGLLADREAIRKSGRMTPELEEVFLSAQTILGRPGEQP
ncbi:hypothetical protein [Pseudooceanicola sp. LIPI14-2-Ac024]|uniref:hypothetical protein n=1 Tax=Pseudooceanicola sp. LIPI14-2-Ac024 TaxID=3344875 RepID=UPI0035D08212